MGDPSVVCPRGHTGEGYRLRRYGYKVTGDGRKIVWQCVGADGKAHTFHAAAPEPSETDEQADEPPPVVQVRCPRSGHRDTTIQSRGMRTTKAGAWRRYSCTLPNGKTHTFRILQDVAKQPVVQPSKAPAPPCPIHADSKVTRAGTYGKGNPRQRYLCRPEDGKAHQFTPPLSRAVVGEGDACKRCDELLSPHHGPITAARHTPWTLVGVAQALNDLSLGESYADVSLALRAQRDAAKEHLEHGHGVHVYSRSTQDLTTAPIATTTVSYSRKQRRNAWRVAADLVEQYAPPLFADVDARYRAEAQALRDANDAALAAHPGTALNMPLVYVLDELPIWTKERAEKSKLPTWNVLTVVEVRWRKTDDPFAPPERDARLRLARAFPRANTDAWQLVLHELGVRPDFAVADNGSGLNAALRTFYGTTVGVVPSLWHIQTNLRDALLKLKPATYLDGTETVLVDPLRKQLSMLGREQVLGSTPADITGWWDQLENIVAALPAPVSGVRAQRDIHEKRLLEALPIWNANPHVPASNATVESQIRVALKPFLENRAHLFGNAERTNRLLNLLVCRQAGVFTDMDELTLRIRQMNENAGGWAPEPRQILDKQPPTTTTRTKRYQSLKSHASIAKLAKTKGIATTAQIVAAKPKPVLSKQKPQTVAALPIREWARTMGLPGGTTGPIRDSVKAAYAEHAEGASDEQARAVFDKAEAERLARIKAKRDTKWDAKTERERTAELAPLREWAKAEAIDLPKNGLIPKNVQEAYEAHLAGKQYTRRPSKQPKRGA